MINTRVNKTGAIHCRASASSPAYVCTSNCKIINVYLIVKAIVSLIIIKNFIAVCMYMNHNRSIHPRTNSIKSHSDIYYKLFENMSMLTVHYLFNFALFYI